MQILNKKFKKILIILQINYYKDLFKKILWTRFIKAIHKNY